MKISALIVLTKSVIFSKVLAIQRFSTAPEVHESSSVFAFLLLGLKRAPYIFVVILCACRQNVAVHEKCLRLYILKVGFVRALFWAVCDGYSDENALVQKRCEIQNSLRDRAKLLYIIEHFFAGYSVKMFDFGLYINAFAGYSASATANAKIRTLVDDLRVFSVCQGGQNSSAESVHICIQHVWASFLGEFCWPER